MWAINLVCLTGPTERTVGPFDDVEDAYDWLNDNDQLGKMTSGEWIRVQLLRMTAP